jgi:hypothetical protein
MKIDSDRLLSLIESHPVDFAALSGTLIKDPKIIPGLIGLFRGGDVLAWVRANQDIAYTLLSQFDAALLADPTLFSAILSLVN